MSSAERFLEVIRQIPAGRVATYGQVARLAGLPRGARQVGWALAALAPESTVPWWRVVARDGLLRCRSGAREQAARLRAEGVPVAAGAEGRLRVSLARYGWNA